ncbi:hypothetical protein ACWDA3_38720 [Nonomuraea rubra]
MDGIDQAVPLAPDETAYLRADVSKEADVQAFVNACVRRRGQRGGWGGVGRGTASGVGRRHAQQRVPGWFAEGLLNVPEMSLRRSDYLQRWEPVDAEKPMDATLL